MEEPSPEVRAFIDAYIDSIDVLRVLLALAREPQRDWTNADVAALAQLSPDAAGAQLDRLCGNGLAQAAPGPPKTYRYAPRADEFHKMVQELIQLDDHRPVTLIRLVYARTTSSAQAFADAFRLRKD